MGKLKRYFTVLIVTLFVGAFITGCALFAWDVDYQRNQVVARVGNTIEIRRYQLEDAWNGWGFQFLQQGLEPEEAINRTLDILIEREILVHLAGTDEFFGSDHNYGLTGSLTKAEYNRARAGAFDSMERQIREVNQQIRDERNMGRPNTPEQPEEDGTIFTPFEKYIITQGTGIHRTFALNLERFEQADAQGTDENVESFIQRVFEPAGATQAEIDLARDTKARVVRLLRNREQGQTFTTAQNTPEAVLIRAIERMQLEEEKNLLTQRFRDAFSMGTMGAGGEIFELWCREDEDESKHVLLHSGYYFDLFTNRHNSDLEFRAWEASVASRSQSYVDSVVRRARDQYRLNVERAIDRFNRGIDTEGSIAQAIINLDPNQGPTLRDVHWVPQSLINNYFTVSHVLVGFTQEEQAQVRELERQLANREITQNDFIRERDAMRTGLTTRERSLENGNEFGPELSVNQVFNIINSEVTGAHNPQEVFRDLMFRFTADSATLNAPFEYTMGVDVREIDADGNRVGQDMNSGMVESFTIASRELRENGQIGDISGIVWSQFGAHIIMYTRDLSDFIFSNSISMFNQTHEQFLFATQSSHGNQTFFDTIVETLTRPEYQAAEDAIIATFKQGRTITIFPRVFRDLWN